MKARLLTLAGFVLSAVVLFPHKYENVDMQLVRHPLLFAIGGLMVGVGTSLGNGCTSGETSSRENIYRPISLYLLNLETWNFLCAFSIF